MTDFSGRQMAHRVRDWLVAEGLKAKRANIQCTFSS